jgi:hypothetical protein
LEYFGLSELRPLRYADEAIEIIKAASRVDLEWLNVLADTTQKHHWIPQQFHTRLEEMYGEIAATTLHFTEPLETGFHQLFHGKSGTLTEAYNARIAAWLNRYGSSKTWEDFLKFIGELRDEYLTLYEGHLSPVNE